MSSLYTKIFTFLIAGTCSYVNRSRAIDQKLVYVQDDGIVIMKGDNSTWLEKGIYRERWDSPFPYSTLVLTQDVQAFGYRAMPNITQAYLFLISTKRRGGVVSYSYANSLHDVRSTPR